MSWDKIRELQMQIYQNYDAISKLRQDLEAETIQDYTFQTSDGQPVQLSELFGAYDTLLIVHNMGTNCSYCTAWADGYSGIYSIIKDKTAFVVSSPNEPEIQTEIKQARGWDFPMVSIANTTFAEDLGYYSEESGYYPGISSLVKQADGSIQRIFHAPFGPSDNYGIVYHTLDLLANNPMN